MILGWKHVGVILNVSYKKFYVCALLGALIKCLYEMHGATIKIQFTVSVYRVSGFNLFRQTNSVSPVRCTNAYPLLYIHHRIANNKHVRNVIICCNVHTERTNNFQ